jgi:hypothetical protein
MEQKYFSPHPRKFRGDTVNLGYANGWVYDKTPTIVEICDKQKHKLWSRNVGKCLTEYGCDICGYKYKVDSSD